MILTPTQDAADALVLRIWQFRVARNRKAIRAAKAMEQWHKDSRSDGRMAPEKAPRVFVWPRVARHR